MGTEVKRTKRETTIVIVLKVGSQQEPTDMFAEMLGTQIKTFVERLYALGARKFLVNNIGPIGCTTSLRSPGSKACDEISNGHVKVYNQQLHEVLVNWLCCCGWLVGF
ncbi:hypothetical protein Vadar_020213 [Vaccinium darrowii]|uniref:Uncharacterized protein n=1 Tax=Vaccinium darrowii TaxID=229202 RepID=A0ACB7Y0C5_9ERIC|nr:hypothetical protein Vadar_020213 [Vaccinium darrowii]